MLLFLGQNSAKSPHLLHFSCTKYSCDTKRNFSEDSKLYVVGEACSRHFDNWWPTLFKFQSISILPSIEKDYIANSFSYAVTLVTKLFTGFDWYKDMHYALVIGFPKGWDPGLIWGLWQTCISKTLYSPTGGVLFSSKVPSTMGAGKHPTRPNLGESLTVSTERKKFIKIRIGIKGSINLFKMWHDLKTK